MPKFPSEPAQRQFQVVPWVQIDFPDDETMRISHEAMYQARFVQSRRSLKRETS
ncbi:hypothetical protein ACQR0Z_21840 [Bradyrhizobium sp. HKCCYLS3077]|uniref:hypothetical protein n=1 Tax=Bradyrhizobium sp. HKCCYLS3077 TaxID=3420761 RepID=UPI003EB78036